ncbi:MAG: hypothetical protein COB29_16200 [Sulfitobacter sp.]|nr:MAG: hypothetical protein COB29_16200 [Sulfitobacter sp.]
MLIALYARNSIDESVSPIEVQLTKCEAWAHKHGYKIIGKFLDETIIDQPVFERPGLSRLIDAVIDNNVFHIVMEHASVISENQLFLDAFYTKMDYLDITLETLKTHSFTPLTSIIGADNKRKLKLRRYADRKRASIISDAMKGKLPGGQIFGYDVGQSGIRKPNLIEAETVRWIFNEYREKQSIKRICNDLNNHNIPAPKGEGWSISTILGAKTRQTGLLRQSLYNGIFTFNKMAYKTNPKTGKRFSVVRPEKEWDHVPIPELALVDREIFEDVQNIINNVKYSRTRYLKSLPEERVMLVKEGAKTARGKRKKYIVGSNLFCGKCHEPLKTTRAGKYSCENKSCKNVQIFRDQIVVQVLKQLSIFTVEDLQAGIEELLSTEKSLSKERKLLKANLSENMSDIRNTEAHTEHRALQKEYNLSKVRLTEVDIAINNLALHDYEHKKLHKLHHKFIEIVQIYMTEPDNIELADRISACLERVEVIKNINKYDLQLTISISGILNRFLAPEN